MQHRKIWNNSRFSSLFLCAWELSSSKHLGNFQMQRQIHLRQNKRYKIYWNFIYRIQCNYIKLKLPVQCGRKSVCRIYFQQSDISKNKKVSNEERK